MSFILESVELGQTSRSHSFSIDAFLLIIFSVTFPIFIYVYFDPISTLVLERDSFIFWQVVLAVMLATGLTTLIIYSVIHYGQTKSFDELLLGTASFNLLIVCFLYLLTTNLDFFGGNPHLSQEKMILIITFGAVLSAVVLQFWQRYRGLQATKRRFFLTLAINLIILPILVISIFFYPESIIDLQITSYLISPERALILSIIVILFIKASYTALREWRKEKKSIDLAIALASIMWILSAFFFVRQVDLYRASEIIGIAIFAYGFLIIAASLISMSVLEPHRTLQELVQKRTQELQRAIDESDYYLYMWSHEFGNTLQVVISYMEMILLSIEQGEDPIEFADGVLEIIEKGNSLIRLVRDLIRFKSSRGMEKTHTDIRETITLAIDSAVHLLGAALPKIHIVDYAEGELEFTSREIYIAFLNLILFLTKNNPYGRITIDITISQDDQWAIARFAAKGNPLSKDVIQSLLDELNPETTALGLGLYSVKIVVETYDGVLDYAYHEGSNIFIIQLPYVRNA